MEAEQQIDAEKASRAQVSITACTASRAEAKLHALCSRRSRVPRAVAAKGPSI
jgi:hypothetical protein